MVSDIIVELMNLVMERELESCRDELAQGRRRGEIGGSWERSWQMPFVMLFDLLRCRFPRHGEGHLRDAHISRAKGASV